MRQTHKTTTWAAIRFLQAALERQARRLQLQHWLLLAIRTAILLLIVLAAAKPFLDQGLLGGNDQPTHRILLFDTSLSMSYANEQEVTRIEQAKQLAKQLVEEGSSADRYTLMSVTSAEPLETGQFALDRQAALAAIKRIEPTLGTADPLVGFAAVKRLLAQQTTTDTVPDRSEVLFFSDLSKNSWSSLTKSSNENRSSNSGESDRGETNRGDADRGEVSSGDPLIAEENRIEAGPNTLLDQLAEITTLTVVDMAATNPTNGVVNQAVTSLELSESLATSGRELEVRAELSHFGNMGEASESTTVELLADGVVLKTETVRMLPNGPTSLDFPVKFDREGAHSVSVRIQGDRLKQDNERWLALNLRSEVRVLCVEGSRGAAQHVADSLNPTGNPESALQPEIVTDADVSGIDLTRFDCVIFCNVAEFGINEAAQIKQYVQEGGGAIFFLGDQIRPDRYRGILSAEPSNLTSAEPSPFFSEEPIIRQVAFEADSSSADSSSVDSSSAGAASTLLPLLIGAPITNPSFGLDPLDYAHPIVEPFRGRERAGLLTTSVSRYHQLELTDNSLERNAQVALALKGGDPLIITSQFGQGRTAVVATAASLKSIDPETGEVWTAMPAWPSFLPLVRGMVRSVVTDASESSACLIGESFSKPLGNSRLKVSNQLLVTRPDESNETIAINADQAWSYGRTNMLGIYEVDNSWSVAVNLDPSESDLTRVALDSLSPQLTVRPATTATQRVVEAFGGNAGIHRTLLLLALALVLTESVVACLFGRGSA